MIVDLEDREEKGSFDLRDGGKLHLRLLSAADLKAMRKSCMKKTVEYPLLDIDPADPLKGKKPQRFEGQDFDADLWQEMLWDLTITAWENLFDKNQKPIPCTKDNKALLMTRSREFGEAHRAGLAALKEAERARTEQAEKN